MKTISRDICEPVGPNFETSFPVSDTYRLLKKKWTCYNVCVAQLAQKPSARSKARVLLAEPRTRSVSSPGWSPVSLVSLIVPSLVIFSKLKLLGTQQKIELKSSLNRADKTSAWYQTRLKTSQKVQKLSERTQIAFAILFICSLIPIGLMMPPAPSCRT